ncbi:sugar transferase [candidate division KSB1 bacterium]|nr:sugar transferase [candidate division KSB1 bacterium]NIR68862.1 sugar transferase [candidate division KSB1 bacterium]NIS27230.1 sugar transferase [candidate division KSB1 bacterium]NIT74115.1 sugar transferase [candidate division KSB1 bacterium]NIU27964.1 sugar transferase [candidate division KSB1 bacterium]
MTAESFWHQLNPFFKVKQNRLELRLLSVEKMRHKILQEQARADRNGHAFSLVAFAGADLSHDVQYLEQLTQALVRRKRLTDEVGWLRNGQIVILLPDTPAEGARKVVEYVNKTWDKRYSEPEWTVYVYPLQKNEHDDRKVKKLNGTVFNNAGGGGPSKNSTRVSKAKTEARTRQSTYAFRNSQNNVKSVDALVARQMPFWKRSMDVIGALLCLFVLSPIVLVIGMVIKMVSNGPVFFKQDRVGYMGRHFKFWKFRTMNSGANDIIHSEYLQKLIESDRPMVKLDTHADPRVYPFGQVLRQTYLDELPQLFNVLRGDMSLVGPRPCLPYEAEKYRQWQNRRFAAVPGLTGLWQVSGKNNTTFKEMIRLDIRYERKCSFWFDLKIMLKTIPFMFEQVKGTLMNVSTKGGKD